MMLNRYMFEGIVSDLERGAEIGVFALSYPKAVDIMHDSLKYLDERYAEVRISSGEIRHASGGRARVFFQDIQARGRRFDTVVVPYGSAFELLLLQLGQEVEVIEY